MAIDVTGVSRGRSVPHQNVIGKFQTPGWVMVGFSRPNAGVFVGAFCYSLGTSDFTPAPALHTRHRSGLGL